MTKKGECDTTARKMPEWSCGAGAQVGSSNGPVARSFFDQSLMQTRRVFFDKRSKRNKIEETFVLEEAQSV
jgi:hypothetical protein